MNLTNKYNYPDSLVQAVKHHLYKPSWDTIRVSELITGLLEKYLLIKHWDTLEVDVDDCILALFGTAWHKFLSGWAVDNEIHDYRWYTTIDNQQFSGETDIYKMSQDGGVIEDNKVTSAWAFVFGRKEWEYQLNSYAYLVRKNQYPVTKLQINAFLRDWSKWDKLKDHSKTYPKSRFYCLEVPLWDENKQLTYLKGRLNLHYLANNLYNNNYEFERFEPIMCTANERWQRKEQFAITKIGNKTAKKLCDTLDNAKLHIAKMKHETAKSYEIVHRKGENKKCEDVCIVRSVCPCKGI